MLEHLNNKDFLINFIEHYLCVYVILRFLFNNNSKISYIHNLYKNNLSRLFKTNKNNKKREVDHLKEF